MKDITNTVAHTPALSDIQPVSLATQEKATQVFFLDIAVTGCCMAQLTINAGQYSTAATPHLIKSE